MILLGATLGLVGCGSSGGGGESASAPAGGTPAPQQSAPQPSDRQPPAQDPQPPAQDPPAPAPTANTAQLEWDASTDPAVAGYRVYYGTVPGAYQQARGAGIALTGTSYMVTGLISGKRYYFAVTSYDAGGNESAFAQEVTKDIP